MLDVMADLWTTSCDARCITTNGTVKPNGRGVMGRGTALQAKRQLVGLEVTLGAQLLEHGNHVAILSRTGAKDRPTPLVIFPVKHQRHERADLDLIQQSARELVTLTAAQGWKVVLLPRPGCGNGQRTWTEVAPILTPILDDRFVVVTL